jgi:hypothetical protein
MVEVSRRISEKLSSNKDAWLTSAVLSAESLDENVQYIVHSRRNRNLEIAIVRSGAKFDYFPGFEMYTCTSSLNAMLDALEYAKIELLRN